jgi:hypothetical protein
MKLVETDSPHGDEEVAELPRPPRPERRRVYVSLALTLTVLVATVAAVYFAFPKRDNEVLNAAIEAHREGGPFEIDKPSRPELVAWSVGVVGQKVPWPDQPGLEIVGTRQLQVLRRPAALVRYRAEQEEVSLMVLRARDAPPRTYRRADDDDLAVSWRRGPWTFVVVGSAAHAEEWSRRLGVP